MERKHKVLRVLTNEIRSRAFLPRSFNICLIPFVLKKSVHPSAQNQDLFNWDIARCPRCLGHTSSCPTGWWPLWEGPAPCTRRLMWAVVFNDGANGGKYDGPEIQDFLEIIAGDRRELTSKPVRDDLLPATAEAEYASFLAQSLALLSPWWTKLAALGSDWSIVVGRAAALNDSRREKYLGLNFLIYGYRGVREYFELVQEHRALLQGAV